MKKKVLISSVCLVSVAVVAAIGAWYFTSTTSTAFPKETMKQAKELQERIISFDAHISIPTDFNTENTEANTDGPYQFDLVKAGSGRLSGAALTIFGWPEIWSGPNAPHRPTEGMLEESRHQQETRYKILTSMVKDYPNQVGIAYTPDDFKRLYRENKFAIVISMLNAYPLGNDISQLDKWQARGMRMFGFNYVGNNTWSDSSRPMPFFNDTADALGGLSELGKQAVTKLNNLGVIIDVSQMSTHALEDVVELTTAPVVASHSAPRGIVDIPRNLSDKELQLIKQTGGVIHVVGFPTYLKPLSKKTIERLNELRAKFGLDSLQMQENMANAHMPGDPVIAIWPESKFGEYASSLYAIMEEEPKPTLDEYVDAIDYVVKKVGIDHVGISSDFNDGGGIEGWNNVADTRNVTAALLQRGYSETDIAKLWGENFLRVWEQVQAIGAEQRSADK